jgi:protein LSM14
MSQVRYEGVLSAINQEEMTVSLQNVQTFGTEGRTEKDNEILASTTVTPTITIPASDVLDLQVLSSPPLARCQVQPNRTTR